jgi:hypothetical protein
VHSRAPHPNSGVRKKIYFFSSIEKYFFYFSLNLLRIVKAKRECLGGVTASRHQDPP